MKHRLLIGLFAFISVCAIPVQAQNRFIVRVKLGLPVLNTICSILGCTVGGDLDGTLGQVFSVTAPASTPADTFLTELLNQVGVLDAELDLVATIADSGYTVPNALYDRAPVDYFGATVPHGYIDQPANLLIRLSDAQTTFHVKGIGTVAVIDTGIDPNHPALQDVLVPGYDFTRNQEGEGDETQDVTFVTTPGKGSDPQWTGQNSAALVTQSTAAVVDGNPSYSDFGHGTMVAGVIHVVAPGARLMPLKAFGADGSGYTSDILRAIYWAEQHNANIINMSFNLAAYSREVANALNLATLQGMICVAAAGNQGKEILTYPAALNDVIGVASTNNQDQRSSFSNYGPKLVWVAAPGEGIVTTYPFATYAAAWGTSFSTPFLAGVAALMLDDGGSLLTDILKFQDQSDSAQAVSHAKRLNTDLGHGRLDAYQALLAWHQMMGLNLGVRGSLAPGSKSDH